MKRHSVHFSIESIEDARNVVYLVKQDSTFIIVSRHPAKLKYNIEMITLKCRIKDILHTNCKEKINDCKFNIYHNHPCLTQVNIQNIQNSFNIYSFI